jgi:hypothetical protein
LRQFASRTGKDAAQVVEEAVPLVMRVRWTTNAANDLAHIVERIREENPAAARRVAQTIYKRRRRSENIALPRAYRP